MLGAGGSSRCRPVRRAHGPRRGRSAARDRPGRRPRGIPSVTASSVRCVDVRQRAVPCVRGHRTRRGTVHAQGSAASWLNAVRSRRRRRQRVTKTLKRTWNSPGAQVRSAFVLALRSAARARSCPERRHRLSRCRRRGGARGPGAGARARRARREGHLGRSPRPRGGAVARSDERSGCKQKQKQKRAFGVLRVGCPTTLARPVPRTEMPAEIEGSGPCPGLSAQWPVSPRQRASRFGVTVASDARPPRRPRSRRPASRDRRSSARGTRPPPPAREA